MGKINPILRLCAALCAATIFLLEISCTEFPANGTVTNLDTNYHAYAGILDPADSAIVEELLKGNGYTNGVRYFLGGKMMASSGYFSQYIDDSGFITSLNLRKTNLGSNITVIPETFTLLHNHIDLSLGGNKLEDDAGNFLLKIELLKNCSLISFTNCNLSRFPKIDSTFAISTLILNGNSQLKESIPNVTLPQLKNLDIENCGISNYDFLPKFTALEGVSLNSENSQFPPALFLCTKLKCISCHDTLITTLPDKFDLLPFLSILDIINDNVKHIPATLLSKDTTFKAFFCYGNLFDTTQMTSAEIDWLNKYSGKYWTMYQRE